MADTEEPRQTYRGNCHCGAFVYEIQVPEIKSVGECNCSICHKKGYLWVFPGKDNFKMVKGDIDQLTGYAFAGKHMEHKFCPTCGTGLMAKALADGIPPSMAVGINAHSLQGINTWDLERSPFDGKNMWSTYEPPAHNGELPRVEIEGAQVYRGSCHCGKVTVALKSKPIDETFDASRIVVCNCSICERGGYVWVYPNEEQVVLAGDDADIGSYAFGERIADKTFCRTCGVHMTNRFKHLNEEQIEGLRKLGMDPGQLKVHPVNLRVLEGVDLSKLTLKKVEGAPRAPLYVDP